MRMITNVGLASEDFLVGISLVDLTPAECEPLWTWLKGCKLGGFNLTFDMAWPWGEDISPDMYHFDTAIAFRYLATEALVSQPHSLEAAIEDLLGWPEEMYQKSWLKEALSSHHLSKDEMWKLSILEPEGYTRYCALDAEASFLLEPYFTDIIQTKGPWDWEEYNGKILPHSIYRIIQAQHTGILVDRDKCMQWIEDIQKKALQLEGELMEDDKIRPYLEEYRQYKIDKAFKLSIKEKRVWAKKSDRPWLDLDTWRFEPFSSEEKRNKASAWQKEYGGRFYKSETVIDVKGKNCPYPRFNFNSTDDMRWLIYDKWIGEGNWRIKTFTPKGETNEIPMAVEVDVNGDSYELDLTKSKQTPTGGDILTLFGETGRKINDYKKLRKIAGDFLWKYYRASEIDGRIHPGLKIYGAATGRGAGS